MALVDLFKRKKPADHEARERAEVEATDELARFRREMAAARRVPAGRLPAPEEVREEELGEPLFPPPEGRPGLERRRAAEPEIRELEEITLPPRAPMPVTPPPLAPPPSWAQPEAAPRERLPERPPRIHIEPSQFDLIISRLDVIENRLKLIEEKLKRF